MEPMSLGSPSNSGPSSPVTTPSASSPFLPSFLLGETTAPNQPPSTSPKIKRTTSRDFDSYTSPKFLFNQTNGNQSTVEQFHHSTEKNSGPPIRGLFDTVTSPAPYKNKPTNDSSSYISNVTRQFDEVSRRTSSHQSTAETTWVTVFGYPAAAATFILSQLASCGNIVARQVPANGNWMHIQFSSKVEAKRALACNGKVFGNSVMVGVVPCKDPTIMEKSLEPSGFDVSTSSNFGSPLSPRVSRPPFSMGSTVGDAHSSYIDGNASGSIYESPYVSPRSARPLAVRHENEMQGRGSTPQKSSGVVSKAMEYILGW